MENLRQNNFLLHSSYSIQMKRPAVEIHFIFRVNQFIKLKCIIMYEELPSQNKAWNHNLKQNVPNTSV